MHGPTRLRWALLLLLYSSNLFNMHVLASPAAPRQPAATNTKHPLIDMSMVAQGIRAAHKEVQQALAAPRPAFDAYARQLSARGQPVPGGPQDTLTRPERLQVFMQNLKEAAELNAAAARRGAVLAYGITPYTHLTRAEFEARYLGQTAETKATSDAEQQLVWEAGDVEEPEPQTQAEQLWDAVQGRKLLIARTKAFVVAQKPTLQPAATSRLQAAAGNTTAPARLSKPTAPTQQGQEDTSPADLLVPESALVGPGLPPAMQWPGQVGLDPTQPLGTIPSLPDGLPMDPESSQGCSGERAYPFSDLVPPADGVNWVMAGRTTAIKDQGECGACVAFASSALAEFVHMRRYGTTNTTTDLSEQDLLDCTLGDGCGGQYQTTYLDLISCSGIALEHEAPYRAADPGDKCRPVRRFSGMAQGRGGGWAYTPQDSAGLAQAVSVAPVLVMVDATDWALYAGGVLDCAAPGRYINHAVAVVGYMNQVPQPNGELWDVFLVRNSFGSHWGHGNGQYAGHILIRKGCVVAPGGLGPAALHSSPGVMPLPG